MRDVAIPQSAADSMHTMATTSNVDVSTALGPQRNDDEHSSHANAGRGVTNIYLVAWQPNAGGSTVQSSWEDEIVGVNWGGSQRTIRFNKTWTSGFGLAATARCPISRQGHYALCASDYQVYNLDKGFGDGNNQDTCDHRHTPGVRGKNGCRIDISCVMEQALPNRRDRTDIHNRARLMFYSREQLAQGPPHLDPSTRKRAILKMTVANPGLLIRWRASSPCPM